MPKGRFWKNSHIVQLCLYWQVLSSCLVIFAEIATKPSSVVKNYFHNNCKFYLKLGSYLSFNLKSFSKIEGNCFPKLVRDFFHLRIVILHELRIPDSWPYGKIRRQPVTNLVFLVLSLTNRSNLATWDIIDNRSSEKRSFPKKERKYFCFVSSLGVRYKIPKIFFFRSPFFETSNSKIKKYVLSSLEVFSLRNSWKKKSKSNIFLVRSFHILIFIKVKEKSYFIYFWIFPNYAKMWFISPHDM